LINAKGREHVLFFLFNVCVALWGFFHYLIGKSTDPSLALLYWKLGHIGSIFIGIFFFHFVYAHGREGRRFLILFSYGYGLAFIALLFTGGLSLGVRYAFNRFYYFHPLDNGYFYVVIIWFLIVIGGFVKLYRIYNLSTGSEKTRNAFLFYSLLIGFGGGCGYFLPLFGIEVYPYGNFLIPIYSFASTYAILRHNLLGIKLVIHYN